MLAAFAGCPVFEMPFYDFFLFLSGIPFWDLSPEVQIIPKYSLCILKVPSSFIKLDRRSDLDEPVLDRCCVVVGKHYSSSCMFTLSYNWIDYLQFKEPLECYLWPFHFNKMCGWSSNLSNGVLVLNYS